MCGLESCSADVVKTIYGHNAVVWKTAHASISLE
jgi:hypothetical protein